MATKRDYYEILGVQRDAAADEIKKAYKKAALKNHPDRNGGDPEATERFKEAAEAFDVLGSAEKRARYDRYGHAGVAGMNGGGFNDTSDVFDAFGDLFEGFFGGRRRSGGSRARRGDSLRTSLSIDLLQAATGCTRELEIERHELCETCGGSGAKPGTSPTACDYCGGQGQVVQSQGFFRVQTTCPACRGRGTVVRDKCPDCHGAQRERKTTRLEVRVPAGVDNDMQLCLRGEGDPGEAGGPRGDLYVEIHVKEHSLFQRHGSDLACRIPITYTQAALGTELEVPILTGKHKLTIPPGTQPGEVFRLRGYGMPHPQGGPTGDLLVEAQIEVPRKLNKRYEELLRELAELENTHVSPHQKSFLEKVKDYLGIDDDEQ